MSYRIAAGIMATFEWRSFRRWQSCAYGWCVELCGVAPDEVPIEVWAMYFDDGLTAQEAGSLMAKCVS